MPELNFEDWVREFEASRTALMLNSGRLQWPYLSMVISREEREIMPISVLLAPLECPAAVPLAISSRTMGMFRGVFLLSELPTSVELALDHFGLPWLW